jgi:hypothetical protein
MSCPICYETQVSAEKTKSSLTCPCKDVKESHDVICGSCYSSHINIKIMDAYMGTCPVISCPGLHSPSSGTILDYGEWTDSKLGIVTPANAQKYEELAKSLLSFLCSSCHKMNSLCVPYVSSDNEREDIVKSICVSDKFIGGTESVLLDCLKHYVVGAISADEAFHTLTTSIFSTTLLSDRDCWSLIFEKLLSIIANPERRANLHLRYIRSRPRCWTRCCVREHCFRCRTKEYHEGKTCEEMVDTLDNNMLECPTCGIFLVKGDGCNTVTCVCGSQFSWSAELQVSTASRSFMSTHPTNPSEACANALCDPETTTDAVNNANAWRTRHKIETDRELVRWWKRKFGSSATQACAIRRGMNFGTLPSKYLCFNTLSAINAAKVKRESVSSFLTSLTPGAESAGQLFEQSHSCYVTHAAQQIDVAVQSVFETMFLSEEDRAAAAVKMLCPRYLWRNSNKSSQVTKVDSRMLASAHVWATAHPKIFEAAVEDYESRMARCFLCIYGTKRVPVPDFDEAANSKSKSYMPNATEWNRAASNTSLEFEDAATAKRPGGASCYPAAFAVLPDTVSYCAVRIIECAVTQNTLSFGLAKRTMAKESSDGVGRTSSTWGIHDERGSSSEVAKASSSGTKVATCPRKFAVGDVLKCAVDLERGTCEISINETEFVHTFNVPPGKPDEYYFAMTFANDHKVTLIDVPSPGGCEEEMVGIYNAEHAEMYRALIVRLRKILAGDKAIDTSRILDLAEKYPQVKMCSRGDCCRELLKLQPLIAWVTKTKPHQLQEGHRSKIRASAQLLGDSSPNPQPLAWQELVYAICYMTVNKQDLKNVKSQVKKLARKSKRQNALGPSDPVSPKAESPASSSDASMSSPPSSGSSPGSRRRSSTTSTTSVATAGSGSATSRSTQSSSRKRSSGQSNVTAGNGGGSATSLGSRPAWRF